MDSKTGQPVPTSEIEVTMRAPQGAVQAESIPPFYVNLDKNGKGEATFPVAASDLRVYARDGEWGYVNCDSANDRKQVVEHWYPILEILRSGLAAPNNCNKRGVVAKPGEFVFFVRPMTLWEKMK